VARTVKFGMCAVVLLAACGDGVARSHVEFTNFSLMQTGIVFELHPTDSPVLISAAADPPLEVCPVGTSFGSAWRRGCLKLGDTARALPTTNGLIHVVFRIASPRMTRSDVRRLELQWHCVDHRFSLERHDSRVPASRASFDC
jgi:hypothetical protein